MSNLGHAWEGKARPVGEVELMDAQLEGVYGGGASQVQMIVCNVLQFLDSILSIDVINKDGSKPVSGSVTETVTPGLIHTEIHEVKSESADTSRQK